LPTASPSLSDAAARRAPTRRLRITIAGVSPRPRIGANSVVFGVLNDARSERLECCLARKASSPSNAAAIKTRQPRNPDYLDLRDRNALRSLHRIHPRSRRFDTGKIHPRPGVTRLPETTSRPWTFSPSSAASSASPMSMAQQCSLSGPLLVVLAHPFSGRSGVVGRVVQVNKTLTNPRRRPADFSGTLIFFYPDFWAPMVQQEQIQGSMS